MALYVNNKYAKCFVTDEEIYSYQDKITKAHNDLHNKTGAGNDFTGWVDLPVNYDKDEFARIKVAAEKIKNNSTLVHHKHHQISRSKCTCCQKNI